MVPHGPLNPDFEPKPSILNPNMSLRKGANVGTLRDERLCSANASRPSINFPQKCGRGRFPADVDNARPAVR